jgi:hypothetical protein
MQKTNHPRKLATQISQESERCLPAAQRRKAKIRNRVLLFTPVVEAPKPSLSFVNRLRDEE